MLLCRVIISVTGALVGRVRHVRPHPQGSFISLADVNLGSNILVQIVFGGDQPLSGGDLVPVAPPGSWVDVRGPRKDVRRKKMRARNYRGQRSHGMLCSLDELGWTRYGLNEVAILRDLTPGESLDDFPVKRRPEVVVGWERATLMERMTRTPLMRMFDPAMEAPEELTARNYRTRSRLVVH